MKYDFFLHYKNVPHLPEKYVLKYVYRSFIIDYLVYLFLFKMCYSAFYR